ncbi:MAG TPA: urate hydroxylase PuuD [Macromonas sp.]|nr:urate hydroxylase PuuD [Macromonas sp.]
METYLLDWANLLLRWVHVVTAIAWIGSSFYFVFLDNSLTPPQDEALRRDGATGELWAVHGGGFYHPVKYAVAPPRLPERLHWFYWESYSTWLSGFALFALTYLWQAPLYLVDPQVMSWSTPAAIASALAFLVVFWLLYDAACRTLGPRRHGDAWVGLCVLLLVGAAAWGATQLFAGRAAFLLVGAMLATAMSANVAHWIIPGQRKVVAALRAGQPVDPVHGQRGKQRSVHNTYFTLPVVFAMLSTHYSFLYSHPQRAWILLGLMLAGAAIRQFFVLRHGHKLGRHRHPWPYAAVGVVLIAGLVWVLRPAASVAVAVPERVSDEQVLALTQQRCAMCHGAQLQSKNVRLDTLADLHRLAPLVYQQVVVSRAMPLNNATGITEDERALVARWYASRSAEN